MGKKMRCAAYLILLLLLGSCMALEDETLPIEESGLFDPYAPASAPAPAPGEGPDVEPPPPMYAERYTAPVVYDPAGYDAQKYQIQQNMQDLTSSGAPLSDSEKQRILRKWRTSELDEGWREYRGDFVKVQMLRTAKDLREMRLIFRRGSKPDMFLDGEISDVINAVAAQVIKESCGRKSKTNLIVYNNASSELARASPFYDYDVINSGAAVREIGFRCIY